MDSNEYYHKYLIQQRACHTQFLIEKLLQENSYYRRSSIPTEESDQRRLLRGLMNIREPKPSTQQFLKVQDEYLQEELRHKIITDYRDLSPIQPDLYLWRGDITTLKCGAIVNAANSGMTGCYSPCHNCIDNCIHTFAGIQLRQLCGEIMERQGYEEPTGQAKITPAFNLPCDYILHTVGPIVEDRLTKSHCDLLASCYRSCLELAEENGVDSVAFCCISTGVFHFPNEAAAEIAIQTVKDYKAKTGSKIKVIFNVFLEQDEAIYRRLLR